MSAKPPRGSIVRVKPWTLVALLSLGFSLHVLAEPTLPERYLDLYVKINQAEQLERRNDYKNALTAFEDCYQQLLTIRSTDPDWEAALVVHRIDDMKAKILELNIKINPPALAANAVPVPAANDGPVPAAKNAMAPLISVSIAPRPHRNQKVPMKQRFILFRRRDIFCY